VKLYALGLRSFISANLPHPPSPSPAGEGAVLHIFDELYNYHINFNSLFITFQCLPFCTIPSKSEGCALFLSLRRG